MTQFDTATGLMAGLGIGGLTRGKAEDVLGDFGKNPETLAAADSSEVETSLASAGIKGADKDMAKRVKGAALTFIRQLGATKYDADAEMPSATPAAAAPVAAPAAPADPTGGLGTLLTSVIGYGHLALEALIPLFAANPNDAQIQAALREKAPGAKIFVRKEGAGKQALLDAEKTLAAIKKFQRGGQPSHIGGALTLTLESFLQETVDLCPLTGEERTDGVTDVSNLSYKGWSQEDLVIFSLGVVTGEIRSQGKTMNQVIVSTFREGGQYGLLKAQLGEWGDDDQRVLQAKARLTGTVSPQATGGSSPSPLAQLTQRVAAPSPWNGGNRVT